MKVVWKQRYLSEDLPRDILKSIVLLLNILNLSTELTTRVFRTAACRRTLDLIIEKIERHERTEERKELRKRFREESMVLKLARLKGQKLDTLLQKRKETLKKQIMRKRYLLEKDMTHQIQGEMAMLRKRRYDSSDGEEAGYSYVPRKRLKQEGPLYCVCKTPYSDTECVLLFEIVIFFF